MKGNIILGDCVETMKSMDECSVDAIVTDPPYGLKFMGKEFDSLGDGLAQQLWHSKWTVEALRVLKPGGHILAFGGTRTYHRLVCALEDSGFEIRDCIVWLYGQGFPKNRDISKDIDKIKGAERKPVGYQKASGNTRGKGAAGHYANGLTGINGYEKIKDGWDITAPAAPEAKQWEGWGTALKPAMEPICLARKPVEGTIANNVLKHGTGGLNIDGSLISLKEGIDDSDLRAINRNIRKNDNGWGMNTKQARQNVDNLNKDGRYPANVILDDEAGKMLDGQTGNLKSGYMKSGTPRKNERKVFGKLNPDEVANDTFGDSGGASRFFYCAKASKRERDAGLDESFQKVIGHNRFDKCTNCGGYILQNQDRPSACKCKNPVREHNKIRGNFHPTVKAVSLMKYLIKLITPPNGTVLDPFFGSGTTGVACELLGFKYIGIEKEKDYLKMAKARCRNARLHPGDYEVEKSVKKLKLPKMKIQSELF